MPNLCLGTAQFGLAYGVTNTAGQVPEKTLAALLIQAREVGVCWLDTAQSYGNSEAVLGRQLPEAHGFRMISKLKAQKKTEFKAQDEEHWEQAFKTSCQRLGVMYLDAFLLHSTGDLAKPGGHHLNNWLKSLRSRGLVKRLGVSIYNAKDLECVDTDLLDMVQLPLSLFDQRLRDDGTISRLRANGTAVHARSIFLQGLLLSTSTQWPEWVDAHGRAHQKALEDLAEKRKCRLIDLALGFARHQEDLEAVVVGICTNHELTELKQAWGADSPWQKDEWKSWSLKDPSILDPRRWPR